MAYYSGGGTVHAAPAHHLQSQYGYPQQQSWPPVYYDNQSHRMPPAQQPGGYSPQSTTIPPPQIQPDPLPPHSNPQDLSPTQSRAFSGPMPCTPIRLGKDDVLERNTNMPLLTISREAIHMPSFLSSKPLLTITRCNTNARLGTIRFHNMTTSDIELSINGRETVLSSSRLHKRWSFQPSSLFDTKKKSSLWYWKRDSVRRSAILVDGKKRGSTVARIDGNTLSFEKAGLGPETLDEIVMTAVALAEHARRHSRNADVVDLGGNIADLIVGHNGSGGGVATHHGGGLHGGGHHGGFFVGGGDGGGGGGVGDGGGGGGGCGGGGGGGDGGGGGGGGGC